MKRKLNSNRGFTLIELLVVVLIIVILSGMLFKIAGMVGDKAARARAIADLENIQNALNEYYSEYGMYPPTDKNSYVYENTGAQSEFFRRYLARLENNDPNNPNFFADIPRTSSNPTDTYAIPKDKDRNLGYEYGLVSYLYFRDRGTQVHWYDADTDRDIAAKRKWQHFLDKLNLNVGGKRMIPPKGMQSQQPYTNQVATIVDPWGRGYYYECKPPYMKYRLWSDGQYAGDPADDIHNDAYSE